MLPGIAPTHRKLAVTVIVSVLFEGDKVTIRVVENHHSLMYCAMHPAQYTMHACTTSLLV